MSTYIAKVNGYGEYEEIVAETAAEAISQAQSWAAGAPARELDDRRHLNIILANAKNNTMWYGTISRASDGAWSLSSSSWTHHGHAELT